MCGVIGLDYRPLNKQGDVHPSKHHTVTIHFLCIAIRNKKALTTLCLFCLLIIIYLLSIDLFILIDNYSTATIMFAKYLQIAFKVCVLHNAWGYPDKPPIVPVQHDKTDSRPDVRRS